MKLCYESEQKLDPVIEKRKSRELSTWQQFQQAGIMVQCESTNR